MAHANELMDKQIDGVIQMMEINLFWPARHPGPP